MRQMRFPMAALSLCACLMSGPVASALPYTLVDLGAAHEPQDINNLGQVTGITPTDGFVWPPEQSLPPLPGYSVPRGYGINGLGWVVGMCYRPSERATKWSPSLSPTDLGGSMSMAHGINDGGEVVGQRNAPGSNAVYWRPDGTMEVLPLPGDHPTGMAWRINNASINGRAEVVGLADTNVGANRHQAYSWTWNGSSWVHTALADLPGGNSYNQAIDINDAGVIVGAGSASTGWRACKWNNRTAQPQNLGDLAGGSDESRAYGVNNAGQIVGHSYATGGPHAFLWDATNGMRDLNGLLDSSGAGWTLVHAAAVNDDGWIVGYGIYNGVEHGYLLTPEPATFAFLGLGYLLVMRRRRPT